MIVDRCSGLFHRNMNFMIKITVMLSLLLCATGYAAENGTLTSFRLYDSTTKQILSGATVSIYDGFGTIYHYAGPFESDNTPYCRGNKKTTSEGFLMIDLSELKKDALLLQADKYYKVISRKGKQIVVVHYQRKNMSLEVTGHYIYNLETGMVAISRIPNDAKATITKFTYIDIPMDY